MAKDALRSMIAIVGMGVRFPGACSPEDLWREVLEGRRKEISAAFEAPRRDLARDIIREFRRATGPRARQDSGADLVRLDDTETAHGLVWSARPTGDWAPPPPSENFEALFWGTASNRIYAGCARGDLFAEPEPPSPQPRAQPRFTDYRASIVEFLHRLMFLWQRADPGRSIRLLAQQFRSGRLWADYRSMRPPGRIMMSGGHATRGPDTKRMTRFLVIRGVSLALR